MDRKWWTLIAVGLGVFLLLVDVSIVNVALANIQHSFGASLSDLQWVLDAYALTLAALLLTVGSLADLYGRRRLYLIGTVIFTIGSLLCGSAPSALFLSIARAGQGIGGAIMFSTSLALLASAFHGRERGTAFAVFGGITGIALAIGPVLGGLITSDLTWRWIFYVNIPTGIACLAITLWRVDESREPSAHPPDWIGFFTFSVALAALVYGLIRASTAGWTSHGVLGCFAVSLLLLLVFLAAEQRQDAPMFDMTLLRKPAFSGGLIAGFAYAGAFVSLIVYYTLYFRDVLGLSPIATGERFLVLTGVMFVTAVFAGRLTTRVQVRLLIGPGFLLCGVGLLLMRGLDASSLWTHFIPGFILGGAGSGLINAPLASTAVGVVEPERAGMASGISATSRQVGIATGIAAFGAIFASRVTSYVGVMLAHTPLATHAGALGLAVASGQADQVIAAAPSALRAQLAEGARGAFAHGLNDIFLIGAIVAFAAAATSLLLIRQRDFVQARQPEVLGGAPGEPLSGEPLSGEPLSGGLSSGGPVEPVSQP